jgi:outer membrane receptor protein involved in Fe transport
MTTRWILVGLWAVCAIASAHDEEYDFNPAPTQDSSVSQDGEEPNQVADAKADSIDFDVAGKFASHRQPAPRPFAAPPSPLQGGTPRAPAAALGLAASIFGSPASGATASGLPSANRVTGTESKPRLTTDAGSLLGKSPTVQGVTTQKRTPIVNDPRSRGAATGPLLASGSYWMPARQDLDTLLNKLDSRIVEQITVIKGPYSAFYGPGSNFIDVELLPSPRVAGGYDSFGSTSIDYNANGEQLNGRQTVWGGDDDWGFRLGYGHKTGNDYEAGNGVKIPTSYKSRDWEFVVGKDLSPDASVEFHYLRLDQTDVEFPGQPFDMNFLVTDSYEVEYRVANQPHFDRLTLEAWYNQTRFAGDSLSPSKQAIPVVDSFDFVGFTDAYQSSAGYSLALTWGDECCAHLTAGTDLRHIKQRIDELNLFRARGLAPGVPPAALPPIVPDGNVARVLFPPLVPAIIPKAVPDSHSVNPGLFAEQVIPLERGVLRTGGRFDWVSTSVEDSRVLNRVSVGGLILAEDFNFIGAMPPVFEPIIPVVDNGPVQLNQFLSDRDFALWSGYITGEYEVDCHNTATGAVGFSMRPPTLTELYAFNGPFLAILQRGGNFVFGDSTLDPDKRVQFDLGLRSNYGPLRAGGNVFYALIHDYITLRPQIPFTGVLPTPPFPPGIPAEALLPPGADAVQPVQFTNTDLATLSGGELFAELDLTRRTTAFATLSYVRGTDLSRDESGQPLPLTIFTPFVVPDTEPLPVINPLESRLGFRLHEAADRPRWGIELAARVVDRQTRVARTLREQETPGFTVWDVRSVWHPSEQLSVVAGIENLTDKFYREHLDLRPVVFQPGISFYAGTEVHY